MTPALVQIPTWPIKGISHLHNTEGIIIVKLGGKGRGKIKKVK